MLDDEKLEEEVTEEPTNTGDGDNGSTDNDPTTTDTTEGGSGDQSDVDPTGDNTDPVEDPTPVEPSDPEEPTPEEPTEPEPEEPADPTPEEPVDPDPEKPEEPAVDPADDPAVVVDFNKFTAEKMQALVEKANELTDEQKIDMITAQVLNRVKALASKGQTELSVSYSSATIDFKQEYRQPVIDKLTSLGYTVTEETDEETIIGIKVVWATE